MASTIVPAPVPDFSTKVNISAVKSGNASDSSVWGRALQAGDYASVPAGTKVVWDLTTSPRLGGIVFSGTLDTGSAPGDKQMILADLICLGGAYKCGSCLSNTPLNGTFTLTFTDTAPDPTFDPGQFGNGFLTMGGTVDQCGSANKTAWVFAQGTAQTSNQITLASAPVGWNAGDEILVPGTLFTLQRQDEVIKLAAINGNVITLASPLAYDHSTPVLTFAPKTWITNATITNSISYTLAQKSDGSVTVASAHDWTDSASGKSGTFNGSFTWPKAVLVNGNQVQPLLAVGNLTRNIVWQSENPSGARGHVMFMRGMDGKPTIVNACHVEVRGMGRTKATQVVTDPMVDTSFTPPQLVAGTAANPRARYAWHSHRQTQGTGYGDTSALQTWDGIVVRDALKWSYDNHDSNVKCTNCIAYDFDGAGFATERGTEIGEYTSCLAVGGDGIGDGLSHANIDNDPVNIDRFPADDMGFIGNGFWLQGSGVTVNGCVSAGAVSGGFFWMPEGPKSPQSPGVIATQMPWANLPPALQTALAQIPAGIGPTNPPSLGLVPPYSIGATAPNLAFACNDAGTTAWNGAGVTPQAPATIENCLSFNTSAGTNQQYAFNVSFNGTIAIGPYAPLAKLPPRNPNIAYSPYSGATMNPAGYGAGQQASNNVYIGWDIGFLGSIEATGPLADGYYANLVDVWLVPGLGTSDRNAMNGTIISGNPIFAPLQQPAPVGTSRLNLYAKPAWPGDGQNWNQWFDINNLFDDRIYTLPNNWQFYFAKSADNAIPFPYGAAYDSSFPQQFVNATNAEIVASLGIGLFGVNSVSPVPCPWTSNGVIGVPQDLHGFTSFTYPRYFLSSPTQAASNTNYVPQLYNGKIANQPTITYPSVNLASGWNFLTLLPAGFPQLFAVYGPGALPPPPPAPNNLFSDPDFATPNVGTGGSAYQYNPSGAPWTYSTQSGVAGNGSDFTNNNPNAPQGTQVAFIQGQGSISQIVNIAAGSFSVSVYAAQRAIANNSQTFAVQVDGQTIATFAPTNGGYVLCSTNAFTLTAGAHTIAFVGLNPKGGDNTALLTLARLLATGMPVSPPPSPPPVPPTPAGLAAHCNQVSLTWSAASNATGYNLRRSPDGMTWTALATGLAATSFTDTTAVAGSTFFYQVQASNMAGVSAWSSAVQIAVP